MASTVIFPLVLLPSVCGPLLVMSLVPLAFDVNVVCPRQSPDFYIVPHTKLVAVMSEYPISRNPLP